jgi:hypothetical protein
MSLADEPWKSYNEAKVAKIARAMSQDVGKNFRDDTLYKLFPKKIIKDKKTGKEVDIGKISREWYYRIIVLFEIPEKKMEGLIILLIKAYRLGVNIENNIPFINYIAICIAPTFSKKLKTFSQIAKLSFMDDLDRKNKSRKANEGDDIQW